MSSKNSRLSVFNLALMVFFNTINAKLNTESLESFSSSTSYGLIAG